MDAASSKAKVLESSKTTAVGQGDVQLLQTIGPSTLMHNGTTPNPHGQPLNPASRREVSEPLQEAGNIQTQYIPPDGGLRAWLVVVGATAVASATFGLMTAVGLFQTKWQQHQLEAFDATQISWIISVFGFLTLFFSAYAGAVCDRYGSSWLLIWGSAMYGGSFLGLAFSERYGHFMGCFAVAGLGASLLTTAAFSVINHWFDQHKGFAFGVCTMGSGVGGLFFSLVLKVLFEKLAWRTSMFVLSATICPFLIVGILSIKERIRRVDGLFDVSCFRSLGIVLFTFSVFGFEFVLYTAWGLLPSFAEATGRGDQFLLMIIFNAGSTVGRLGSGCLADKLGAFNATIMMCLFTLVSMLVIWLPFGDESGAALYVAGASLGAGTGSFVPMTATCFGRLSEARNSGKVLGAAYTVTSFATLTSNPVSQLVLTKAGSKAVIGLQIAVLSAAMVSCAVVRWACLGNGWRWKARV